MKLKNLAGSNTNTGFNHQIAAAEFEASQARITLRLFVHDVQTEEVSIEADARVVVLDHENDSRSGSLKCAHEVPLVMKV